MRFPEINSRGEAILQAFFDHGAMTIYQGAEKHGEFPSARAPLGVDHAKMVELYCDLVDRGCLIREGIKYRLSLQAQFHFEKRLTAKEPPRSLVPPRVRDFLAKPLFLGYAPGFPWRLAL